MTTKEAITVCHLYCLFNCPKTGNDPEPEVIVDRLARLDPEV
jgi:hypothetical protein